MYAACCTRKSSADLVRMTVVHVGIVRMGMNQPAVDVPMGVRLASIPRKIMRMRVMFVM